MTKVLPRPAVAVVTGASAGVGRAVARCGPGGRGLGSIDVWVNNAMATIFAPVEAVTPEAFARVTQVTYLGQVHGTLAALRDMRPRAARTANR
jgi:NAD(P)-dependent dehydrogenase (short-subunit alcohol dehydrogenase family)